MLDSLLTWLLLPLGAMLGWTMAKREPARDAAGEQQAALGGLLNRLADDDPDQAIATLTHAAEPSDSAVELHLALGNLFRKRGEVDRALRLHEALLARSTLEPQQRQQVRFELAQDYLKAGFLDRAEQLFEELAAEGVQVVQALEQILAIFEQGRDWKHAIDAARRLEGARGESKRAVIAQYFCELAEEAGSDGNVAEAIKLARRALDEHKECVRAWLLLGRVLQGAGDFSAAITAYRHAFDQDPRFLPEVIAPLGECYAQARDAGGYISFLAHARESGGNALAAVAEARVMRSEGMDATGHLTAALDAHPSRALLLEFLDAIEKKPEVAAAGLSQPAASLRTAVGKLLESSPRYRCAHCGFTARALFWQCPTCRQWASIAPIEDSLKTPA